MPKEKMTVTIGAGVLSAVDEDARSAGVSRSKYVETVLAEEHYRRLMARVEGPDWSPGEEELIKRTLEWQNDSVA